MEKQALIKVTGMSCEHCVKRVKDTLSAIDGVSNVEVSLKGGKTTFAYDEEKVTLDTVTKEVENAGYGIKKGLFR